MSYELIAVGGSGQWFLLELLARRRRNPAAPLPTAVHIIDPDQPVPAPNGAGNPADRRLPAVLADALQRAGVAGRWYRPVFGAADSLAEAVPDERRLERLATDSEEATLAVNEGFFGKPRLTAVCVSIGEIQDETGRRFLLLHGPSEPNQQDPLLQQGGLPILVVGSVMGGTGAGLLPMILQQLRRGACNQWYRPVTVVAMTPWFNPPVGASGPDWLRVCANAAEGLRALEVIRGSQRERITEAQEQGLPLTLVQPTRLVVAGPPLGQGQALDAATMRASSYYDGGAAAYPVLASVADAVGRLVASHVPTDPRNGETLATTHCIAVPRFEVEVNGASQVLDMHQVARRFVDRQVRALAMLDHAAAAQVLPVLPIQRTRGFGRVLGGVILTVASGPAGKRASFWRALREGLLSLAGQPETLPTAVFTAAEARDPDKAVAALDVEIGQPERRAIWNLADIVEVDAEKAAAAVASRIHQAFTRRSEAIQDWTLREGLVHWYRLLPNQGDDFVQDLEAETNPTARLLILMPTEIEAVSRALQVGAQVSIENCESVAWATVLGFVHVLDRLARARRTAVIPAGSARHRTLQLWRGLLHGLLHLESFDVAARLLTPTEGVGWQAELGDAPRRIRLRKAGTGQVLGLMTTSMGPTPRASILDGDPAPTDWTALEAQLSAFDEASDRLLLTAWARHVCPQPGNHPPGWYALLYAATTAAAHPQDPGAAVAILRKGCVRGRTISLAVVHEVRFPLACEPRQVKKAWGAKPQNGIVEITAGGPVTYSDLAGDRAIGETDADRSPVWLDREAIKEVADQLPEVMEPIAALEW